MGASKNPTTAVGDIIYASAANTGAPATLSKLSAGTDGYYLRGKGAAAPQWDSPATVNAALGDFSARRILGGTSGTAVPSGYIGETIKATITTYTLTGSFEQVTNANLAIPLAGTWLVSYSVPVYVQCSGTNGNTGAGTVQFTNTSGTLVGSSSQTIACTNLSNTTNTYIIATASYTETLELTAQTYKLYAKIAGTGASGSIYNTTDYQATFQATRIA